MATKRKAIQLELPAPRTWGGRRAGAGRPVKEGRRNVRHSARPAHREREPVHVVMRSRFRPLRSRFVFPTLRRALAQATRARVGFRIVHFSVQADHLHLIVEASGKRALSRGIQGLSIRVARAINRLVSRSGKVWADRYFARALTSPRAVRRALVYVLNNFRKHRAPGVTRSDPYSSARYLDSSDLDSVLGASAATSSRLNAHGLAPPSREQCPVVEPKTWLLKVGWRRGVDAAYAG